MVMTTNGNEATPAYNDEWENAYRKKDNFVFYPEEELVRFISRHIRKRVGLEEWEDRVPGLAKRPKGLDLGCGIGRHLVLGFDFHFDMQGIDLSEHAVEHARKWLAHRGISDPHDHTAIGSVELLPWQSESFDFAISHAVLDSMPFETAQAGCREVHRVLKPESLFYFDVISGHESGQGENFAGELTVEGAHEKGTIQSYFDAQKIDALIGDQFQMVQKLCVVRTDLETGNATGRWHVVARKH